MKEKTKKGRRENREKEPPEESWLTGDYAMRQQLDLLLPKQFLCLCKLTGVTPRQLLFQFMSDLGRDGWRRREKDGVRKSAASWFLRSGYGQDHYARGELRKLFRELDAIGMLWPEKGDSELTSRHARWRNHYYVYLFEKWYGKLRRKP